MQENVKKTLAAHLEKARRDLLEAAQSSAQKVRAGKDNAGRKLSFFPKNNNEFFKWKKQIQFQSNTENSEKIKT